MAEARSDLAIWISIRRLRSEVCFPGAKFNPPHECREVDAVPLPNIEVVVVRAPLVQPLDILHRHFRFQIVNHHPVTQPFASRNSRLPMQFLSVSWLVRGAAFSAMRLFRRCPNL